MPNQPARDDDPMKGHKTGGWTKYGGGRYGIDKTKLNKSWACQACGKKQPKELKPFLFMFSKGEYLRFCNTCFAISRTGLVFRQIIKIVRRTRSY